MDKSAKPLNEDDVMSANFTGSCLCGAVQFESAAEPSFQANCHCDDCRKSGGSVFASFVFVPVETFHLVQGETQSHRHLADSGNEVTKYFCANCGSQIFNTSSGKPERVGIRVGVIDDAGWFQPKANVYCRAQLPSTPVDNQIASFDKMPR